MQFSARNLVNSEVTNLILYIQRRHIHPAYSVTPEVIVGEGRAVCLVPWLVRFHPERGLKLLSYHLCFVLPPARCSPETFLRSVRHCSTLFCVICHGCLLLSLTQVAHVFLVVCFALVLCEVDRTVLVFAVMCMLLFYSLEHVHQPSVAKCAEMKPMK